MVMVGGDKWIVLSRGVGRLDLFSPGAFGEGFECSNKISGANFLVHFMFHSNYGSILLSFRDMTTGRTTDGPTL